MIAELTELMNASELLHCAVIRFQVCWYITWRDGVAPRAFSRASRQADQLMEMMENMFYRSSQPASSELVSELAGCLAALEPLVSSSEACVSLTWLGSAWSAGQSLVFEVTTR